MTGKIKFIIRGILGFFENLEKIEKVDLNPEIIGKSIENNEIKLYRLGSGKRKVLLIGCTHGNEVGTTKLLNKFLNIKNNFSDFSLFVIPTLNIDGFTKAIKNPNFLNGGTTGRTNSNNVDLNRNFDTQDWKEKGIWEFGNKKVEVSGGVAPFSEPEIKALKELIEKEEIEVILDFHNRARTVLATEDTLGKKLAEVYSKYSGYKNITGSEWQNTGWIKTYCSNKKITYLEIETGKRWGSDWEKNKEAIERVLGHLNNQ